MHALKIEDSESSGDEISDNIRRRSTINLGTQRIRNYRRFRLKVYNFLEKPLNAASAPYHFCIFGLVLTNIILGAATDGDDSEIVSTFHFFLEIFMVSFFILEFLVRLWSVKADAKYRKRWGRVFYLFNTVTIIDLIIIPATVLLLIFQGKYVDGKTLDSLRFIQILRLFHVDRQMATWKLLQKMIMLSKWQLLSAYYITLVLGITMATIIYTTEANAQNYVDSGYALKVAETAVNVSDATFPTMAHSWWFTAVTVLTIGYGDIVPKGALTKIIVCFLGFVAFCTFQAANTQISVGMTLMMEEENKKQCKARLRNIAASTIQCWWRYHLATYWRSHRRYVYFTHVCYKLYVTEERINQNRALAKKIKEKLEKRRSQKKKSITHQSSVTAEILKMGIKGAVKPVLERDKVNERKSSLERKTSFHRRTQSEDQNINPSDGPSFNNPASKKRVMFARAKTQSMETSVSSSFDASELEAQMEMRNILEENNNNIEQLDPRDVDISLLIKYRPLLRFYNFVMFRFLMKKFRIQRKAGELLAIEAEIAERENARNTKMKELEATIISLVGKPTSSPFDYSSQKIAVIDRVMFCEEKLSEIELKIERISELTMRCLNMLEGKAEDGLPPKPPGKKGPQRKVTITEQFEPYDYEDEDNINSDTEQ